MKRKQFIQAGLMWFVLALFMSLTKPYAMPVSVLVVPFILFGLAIFASWQACTQSYKNKSAEHNRAKARLLGIVISITVVFALGLQSLGELTSRDLFVVVLFGVVAYFYMVRSLKLP